MARKIVKTADGSHTIRIEQWDEQYHSKHGAISESYHVFIDSGLKCVNKKHIAILEMGFGTGLNALISLIEAQKMSISINYTGVEAYPLPQDEWQMLNYAEQLNAPEYEDHYQLMHNSPWGKAVSITDNFSLTKVKEDMALVRKKEEYDLIYFDAFGYRVQPELWDLEVFRNMYHSLNDAGILVTYAAKGVVRRNMQTVGFEVERLPGPPGKREMLRGKKYISV